MQKSAICVGGFFFIHPVGAQPSPDPESLIFTLYTDKFLRIRVSILLFEASLAPELQPTINKNKTIKTLRIEKKEFFMMLSILVCMILYSRV